MTPFTQSEYSCRCEWGVHGAAALAPADVIIVVDVLSFSTCVDIAIARGAAILPFPWKHASAAEFAQANGAILAGKRGEAEYSLSAASFLNAPARLRCVLPSPNGAALSLTVAESGATVLCGCLRNAQAVADAAARLGGRVNVCPAGERWSDGSLRPSLEDLLGAGAILSRLPGTKSPEAEVAIASFEARRTALLDDLLHTGSGRELVDRGFRIDIELAAALDASPSVPRLLDGAFSAL